MRKLDWSAAMLDLCHKRQYPLELLLATQPYFHSSYDARLLVQQAHRPCYPTGNSLPSFGLLTAGFLRKISS